MYKQFLHKSCSGQLIIIGNSKEVKIACNKCARGWEFNSMGWITPPSKEWRIANKKDGLVTLKPKPNNN